jgi:hypothetical protein
MLIPRFIIHDHGYLLLLINDNKESDSHKGEIIQIYVKYIWNIILVFYYFIPHKNIFLLHKVFF